MAFPKTFYRWRPHPWHGLEPHEGRALDLVGDPGEGEAPLDLGFLAAALYDLRIDEDVALPRLLPRCDA